MKENEILTRLRGLISSIINKPQGLKRKGIIIASVVCIALVAGLLISSNSKAEATVLMINGKDMAVVSDEKQVEAVLERIKTDFIEQGYTPVECLTQITYDDTLVRAAASPVNDQHLYNLLKDLLVWEIECKAIEINGEPVINLANEEFAQMTLENLKKYYLPEIAEGEGLVAVEDADFVENVQIVTSQATFDAIKGPDAALEMLIQGKDKIVQHEIKKGDSLWSIAMANNLTVNDLREANPELANTDKLKPGMKINLVKAEPLVQVATVVTATVQEKIPYGITYKNDSSLWRGQQQVEQKGKYGSRQVTYRITKVNNEEIEKEALDEILLEEPVTQVVKRGTKVMVASRGDGGNGVLAWPTRGTITSAYGVRRSSGIHTGMDIDGDTGDPIFAAEDGVVLESGWKGNYGYCVVIDHGDGLSTLYAHLSKLKVSIGQSVKRGDLVGLMGSTGRSTGSHLHFEVRINGRHQNPKRFLE